jgi:hypothetical protein
MDWPGTARPGAAGEERSGAARRGKALQARSGRPWRGRARQARIGKPATGGASCGKPQFSGAFIRPTFQLTQLQTNQMAKFVFRDSFRAFNDKEVTPEVVGQELQRIHEEDGTLRPQAVVNAARPEDAPLHPAFEWNDLVAGEQYRNIQARSLIKTVQIQNTEDSQPRDPVYVNVSRQDSSYEPIGKVVNTPDLFEAAFSQACGRLNAAQQAMQELQRVAKRDRRQESERYERAGVLIARAQAAVLKG